MGLIATSNEQVRRLRGLHLYHFVLSNCSQRVRLALEEKRLPWTSHHVDLPANEHVTPEYMSINPRGVVPTLVHDGQVVIESNDILQYLEERFPEPSLIPVDADRRAATLRHIDAASAIQGAIKALSHELLFRPFRRVGEAEVAHYARHHSDPELVSFLRDFAENGEAWRRRVAVAREQMDAATAELERALAGGPWLSGDAFGLADVSWVVNVHRLVQARYDLDDRPALLAWYGRVSVRPAFVRAVVEARP